MHPSAIISPSAIVHPTASIGAHVFLGDDVSVGAGVIVEELSSLKNCTVADGSHIFPGVRVGSSGLGSHRDLNGTLHHFPHFCKVQIGRNVLVQDNSTIARGTLKDTILEDGVVVGPLSWIAHSVHLQPNVFVGQSVTIAGSVSVGKDTQIWSHAAIKDGLIIGESCVVGMGSVVTHNIPSNTRVFGNPAKPR